MRWVNDSEVEFYARPGRVLLTVRCMIAHSCMTRLDARRSGGGISPCSFPSRFISFSRMISRDCRTAANPRQKSFIGAYQQFFGYSQYGTRCKNAILPASEMWRQTKYPVQKLRWAAFDYAVCYILSVAYASSARACTALALKLTWPIPNPSHQQ